MRFYLLILALLVAQNVYPQCTNTFRLSLQGNGIDAASDLRELPNGDIVIGGQTTSFGAGGTDFFITRMTKDGAIVWSKTFGGANDEQFRRMRVARDGDILLVGQTRSYGNANGEAVAMKIDINGNIRWSVKLSEGGSSSIGLDIFSATDNSVIVSGSSYDSNSFSDWLIAKIDAAGTISWTKRFNNSTAEDAYSVIQKRDTLIFSGDVLSPNDYLNVMLKVSLTDGTLYDTRAYVTDGRGAFGSNIQYSSGQYRINVHVIDGASYAQMQQGIIVLDTLLNPIQTFKINATPGYDNFYFTGFFQTADGGFIATGSPASSNQGYLYRFDQQSNLISTRRYSSSQNLSVYAAIEASDGAIWLIGAENNDAIVMKLDPNGEFEYCTNEPIQRTTTPMSYTSRSFNWINESTYNFQNIQFTPAIANFSFLLDTLCTAPFCGSMQITGTALSCNLADTITYVVSKRGPCVPNWQWILPAGVYSRQVNDSTVKVIYASGGIYNIIVENVVGCVVQRDTLTTTVIPSPRSINLGRDSLFCNVGSLLLDAGAGFQRYLWQDNSNGQTLTVNQSGTYFVKAWNSCNEEFSDTMKTTYRLPSDYTVTPTDTAYCTPLAPIRFSASGGDLYQWSPATYLDDAQISNPVGTPDASIFYTLTITDTVCNRTRDLQVNINVDPPPSILLSKSNDVNCTVGIAQLLVTGGRRYEWRPDASLSATDVAAPLVQPTTTTTYAVKAYNTLGCSTEDSITVYFDKTGSSDIHLPTAFSPNGDGRNDIFRVVSVGTVVVKEFAVFNRWGERVFISNNVSRGWDGRFKGVMQEPGAYYWFVKATSICEGDLFKKGHVILVR